MRDIDELVRSLANEDRKTIIKRLVEAADRVQKRSPEAQERSERYGRILFFLRQRMHSDTATAADRELCDMLAERLRAKGQWKGEGL
jgi:hypothetical protein